MARQTSAIRCDNGPEYLRAAIVEWATAWHIKLEYIQPGKPQQNAYVERFNRTVRYEWLSQYHWDDLDHGQRITPVLAQRNPDKLALIEAA